LIGVTQLRRTMRIEEKITSQRNQKYQLDRIDVASDGGSHRDSWSAEFEWSRGKMVRRIASQSGRANIALPPQIHVPDERFFYLLPLVTGKVASLDYLFLSSSLAMPIKMRAVVIQDRATAIADAIHVRVTRVDGKASVEDMWLDKRGRLLQLEQTMFGRVLRWMPCAADCDATISTPFDPMASLIVRSPFHVPATAINGPIRYVIANKNGTAIPLPITGEQTATSNSSSTVLTICKDCGTEAGTSAAELAHYLQPNQWVQSDAPEIRSFARRSVANRGTIPRRMMGLAEAVRAHMTGAVDYLGYAAASEALRTRSGDCTEFAVLLAAVARAEGIPTRVVFGLVYADRFSGKRNVFSPHAWVQAWDGKRWVSYDAALEKFDATHIAIAVGDGSPQEYEAAAKLLPQWRIEKLGLVRGR
jgi:Transglutaminase-like superfamily